KPEHEKRRSLDSASCRSKETSIMLNLSTSIAYHANRSPDQAALIYCDEAITYAQFYDRILHSAALLKSRGIGKNDVVALFMKNSPAFLELTFAISHVGAVFLPINYRLAPAEARFILDDAGVKLLFVDDEFTELMKTGVPAISVDASAQLDSRLLGEVTAAVPEAEQVIESDLARLMYTSGTTSRPKGVMHSYSNLYWKCVDHVLGLELNSRHRLLVVGPLYHVGAFDLPGIAVLWVGGTMCVHREFDALAVLASIDRHQLNCGWMAPVMLSRVLATPEAADFDLGTFEWCIAGGEK